MKPGSGTVNQVIRVLLVNDQAIVREGLRLLIENQSDLVVVAEAATVPETVNIAKQSQPDVVLLDLEFGGNQGIACLSELLSALAHLRILMLTGSSNFDLHYDAIYKGAYGLVRKLDASDVLLRAIRKVHTGEAWLDSSLTTRLLLDLWRFRDLRNSNDPAFDGLHNGFASDHPLTMNTMTAMTAQLPRPQSPQPPIEEALKIAQLTDRERQVISLVGEGLRNQQIADRLFISVITVRHHLTSIFSKLDIEDRFELAFYAYRHGLAQLPL